LIYYKNSNYFRILQRILLNNLLQIIKYKLCYLYYILGAEETIIFFLRLIKMADKLPVSCNNEIFLLPFTVMRKNFVHRILQNLFFSLRLSFAYFVYFCSCYHTTATQCKLLCIFKKL
jgi:hypothetical protein